MKLQILMSTYNGEKYLDAQLDSLLAQTLCEKEGWEVEILVRDDGSKDRTCEILQAYADKDTRIRYIKEENTEIDKIKIKPIIKLDEISNEVKTEKYSYSGSLVFDKSIFEYIK